MIAAKSAEKDLRMVSPSGARQRDGYILNVPAPERGAQIAFKIDEVVNTGDELYQEMVDQAEEAKDPIVRELILQTLVIKMLEDSR